MGKGCQQMAASDSVELYEENMLRWNGQGMSVGLVSMALASVCKRGKSRLANDILRDNSKWVSNYIDEEKSSILTLACANGLSDEVINRLLKTTLFDVNYVDGSGKTALEYLCQRGRDIAAVKLISACNIELKEFPDIFKLMCERDMTLTADAAVDKWGQVLPGRAFNSGFLVACRKENIKLIGSILRNIKLDNAILAEGHVLTSHIQIQALFKELVAGNVNFLIEKFGVDDAKVMVQKIDLNQLTNSGAHECAICNNPTETAYCTEPCKHTYYIDACITKLTHCPYCRGKIVSSGRVFIV